MNTLAVEFVCKRCQTIPRMLISKTDIVPFDIEEQLGEFGLQVKPRNFIETCEISFICEKCYNKQTVPCRWDPAKNKVFFNRSKLMCFSEKQSLIKTERSLTETHVTFPIVRINPHPPCDVVYECGCAKTGVDLPKYCVYHGKMMLSAAIVSNKKTKLFLISREEGSGTNEKK